MALQRIGKDDTALAIDLERLAGAIERGGKIFPLVRKRCKAIDQLFDVREQRMAAGVECRPVECRITIKTLETVAREHRPIGCRDRNPSLGIEPQREVGHETVHVAPCTLSSRLAPKCLARRRSWPARPNFPTIRMPPCPET